MLTSQQEAQAAAAARKEQRRLDHEARQAAEMAAKAERRAAKKAETIHAGMIDAEKRLARAEMIAAGGIPMREVQVVTRAGACTAFPTREVEREFTWGVAAPAQNIPDLRFVPHMLEESIGMMTIQDEAQAAAFARKEQRRIAHEERQAAAMALKAQKKAAKAGGAIMGEQKMSDFMQGNGTSQAYVNDASIALAQYNQTPPPLPYTHAPVMHFADPALQRIQPMDLNAARRLQEERRQAQAKTVNEQQQLAIQRAAEKKRAAEASAEKQRQITEAAQAARAQKKEENLQKQRELQRKALLDKATTELTVCCDQLLAGVQAQIQQFASQAGEVVRVLPNSFSGGDLSFTVKFKEPHATQTCLNMTLPPIQLTIPLIAKPAATQVCFLHFDLPQEIATDEQVIPALQGLFAQFGTVLEAKVTQQNVAVIHFQEPEAALRAVDEQSQRAFCLLKHALPNFVVGKPSQGKRKRA